MSISNDFRNKVNKMNRASQNIKLGTIVQNLLSVLPSLDGATGQSASSIYLTAGSATFGSGADYSSFASDGTLTFSGSATIWEDLRFSLMQGKQGQTDQPAFSTTEVGYLYPSSDATQIIYIIGQFPHSMKMGSDIHPHIHWKQTQSGSPVFKMDYKWFNLGGAVPANFSTYVMSNRIVPFTSGSFHQLSTGSALISGSDINTVSSMILMKIYRDDNAYTGTAVAYELDIHYLSDGLGSNTEFVK